MVPSHATHYYVDARIADDDDADVRSNHKIGNSNSNTPQAIMMLWMISVKKNHCSILLCKLYFEHMFFFHLSLVGIDVIHRTFNRDES